MANFESIIKESFTQYSGAVIQSRALIDVRDCIKPSARQIFYCMNLDKFTHDKPYQKTLKSIASAFKCYIHGDASCEGIIMRSAQPFSMRYPLVEVEGSYGNPMETGNWAAPRYSSSRLSALAAQFFDDINKDTIDEWRDNYDDTMQYPAVLPSKGFYNIVNGTQGIGIGLASSIPTFNLREVNKALITLLNNPDAAFEEIYCAPDFPTGGTVINENAVKESLRVGNGKACTIRATFEYDEKKNILTVVEIPYNVYTNTICKELEGIVNSEDNPGIDRFNDLTGENPCLKIYLEKNANPENIKNYLYKNTSLQSSYGINMTMLDNGRYPKVFSWKQALQAHIDHEKVVYRRGFEYDVKKISYRINIVEGIIAAIKHIQEVIELIKSSSSTKDANDKLQSFLNINEDQAKAILDIKLAKLAKLESEKYESELKELQNELNRINAILNSYDLFKAEIIKGFELVANKYGDDRRTTVINLEIPKEDKEIANVEPEKCVVILTESGLIKRIPGSAFRTQKRAGKGIKTQDDITSMVIRTNTIDSLMIFSTKGKMYRLLVNNIPEGTASSKGISVKHLVEMENNENPSVIYSIYRDTDAQYVLFTTKNGLVKKTSLEEYIKTQKKTGIVAINLREDDSLVSVNLIKDEQIMLVTKQGMAIRFNSLEIGATSRVSTGIKGINLSDDDEVVGTLVIRNNTDNLAVFTSSGLGKQTILSEFPLQKRAGKGLVCYKPAVSSDTVAACALVAKEDEVLICGDKNSLCIAATDIPTLNRGAQGNQIIKGSKIISVSKI